MNPKAVRLRSSASARSFVFSGEADAALA